MVVIRLDRIEFKNGAIDLGGGSAAAHSRLRELTQSWLTGLTGVSPGSARQDTLSLAPTASYTKVSYRLTGNTVAPALAKNKIRYEARWPERLRLASVAAIACLQIER